MWHYSQMHAATIHAQRNAMRFHIVSSILLSLVFTPRFLAAGQSTQAARLPAHVLVRQIDHILIGSDEPEQLFRLFSEKLGLPVVWPFRSYGQFSSGGVGLGNVNIELIGSEHRQSGLTAVALEPTSLSEVLRRLDAQGLKHGAPAPFSQKDSSGAERLLWTTVNMTNLPPAGTVFFCKYNFDVDERRALINRELESHGGGPLGIESVIELVIGVRNMAAAQHDWSILLGSVRPSQDPLWQNGSGPAIRLVAAQEDHLVLLRVKVKSLERARAFLKGQNLLGVDGVHEISLDPTHIAGADIRLVE
jgi:hypothetical protein